MAGYNNMYGGTATGFEPDTGDPIYPGTPASTFGFVLDARTANQLKEATKMLNTGTKSLEVQMTFPQVGEAIPNSHLEEINRLKKITGIDITLHGPLVDPTGFQGEGRWDETKRLQAERQIWGAIERANILSPDKSIPVTLHASNGLPEPESWEYNPENPSKPKIAKIAVINERSGEIAPLPVPRKDYLLNKEEGDAYTELARINRDQWLQSTAQINQELARAKDFFEGAEKIELKSGGVEISETDYLNAFAKSKENPKEYKLFLEAKEKASKGLPIKELIEKKVDMIGRGDIYVRDAFNSFKEIYNQAYQAAEREKRKSDKEILENIGEEIRGMQVVNKDSGYITDYKKLVDFSEKLNESLQRMSALNPPKVYKELKEFGIEKSAETFGNIAFKAYSEFGEKAPILSIENPPVGMGLSKAEEIRAVIEESRKKFQELAIKDGMSTSEAEAQSKKLIGATWDVGHINMIKKYGFDDEFLRKQAEKIAPFVNKIHLSDNFGYEHTELPMGMGNVPMSAHLQEIKKAQGEKFEKIKQVIETAAWYQHFGGTPAFKETLQAYGSPLYGMKMSPQWNQASDNFGGYFAGYGMNPDIHHSIYGAGFSGLPTELGGQWQGGRSRFSGTPMD